MSDFTWIHELKDHEKAAYTMLLAYERIRRNHQKGYRAFKEHKPENLKTKRFKTALTIALWFEESWPVTRKNPNLDGYIKFVFQQMEPTIPMLGQLKNKRHLREYISAAPMKREIPTKSPKQLTDLYRKVLDPKLSTTYTLGALGLIPKED